MSDGRRLWRVTRGPRVGEDILAWCEECCTEAITWAVTEGHLVLADYTEDGKTRPMPWCVRFVLDGASVGDPDRERPLDEVIADAIDAALLFGEEPEQIHPGELATMAALRDVLRAGAERIDRALAASAPEKPKNARSRPDPATDTPAG